jgi:uncharacterized membrane protein YhaH (DUF805 family)
MDWRNLFLTSQGRIGQKDFWIAWLILFVAGIVLGIIPILGALISLALIYPQVCIYAKRLHDMGKSGWLFLAPLGATIVLVIVMFFVVGASMFALGSGGADPNAAGLAGAGAAVLFALLIVAINLGFLLWVGLSKGDPGTNQYGPPPGTAVAGAF